MILNRFSICQTQKIINKYWDDNAVRDLLQILVFRWAIIIKTWQTITPKNYNLNLVMTEAWISRSLFVAWAMGMRLGRLQYDYGFTFAKGMWSFVQYVQHSSRRERACPNFTVQIPKCKFYSAISQCKFYCAISQFKFHSVFSTIQEENEFVQISQCVQQSTRTVQACANFAVYSA